MGHLVYFRDSLVAQRVESACNVGDLSSIPGLGRSPGEENGNPLQYSCLENPVHGITLPCSLNGSSSPAHNQYDNQKCSYSIPITPQKQEPLRQALSGKSLNLILCAQGELTESARKWQKLLAFLKACSGCHVGSRCSRGEDAAGDQSGRDGCILGERR